MSAEVELPEGAKAMKFKVFVRLRPAGEGSQQNGVCKVEHRIITLHDPTKEHSSEFVFDRVFGADANQEDVFTEVGKPLVEHAVQGYNACCFAYGQTGSGKTYSMFGKETGEHDLRGMIPRAAEELFKAAEQVQASQAVRFSFFVSFLEIYLEQVRDLGKGALLRQEGAGMKPGQRDLESWAKSDLDVMEDSQGNTVVKGLTFVEVKSAADMLAVLRDGYALRTTAATMQNDVSSRSHTVFTMSVVQYREGGRPITGRVQQLEAALPFGSHLHTGRLHLVDLAGSERLSKSQSEGQRLQETKAINKSLTALGKVVMILSQEGEGAGQGQGGKPQHVPFRDTKLTRILKDSLIGNSMTSMLAALNPRADNAEECFNTLQFAVRCQNINLAPHINVIGGPGEGGGLEAGLGGETVEELMEQVMSLQEELNFTHSHYQKIIENVAGPNWTANMGPVERTGGPSGQSGGDTGLERGGSAGYSSAATGISKQHPSHTAELTRLNMGGLSEGAARAPMAGAAGSAEARMKRLEAQLAAAQSLQKETEAKLEKKRSDYDEMRDRMLAKDLVQFAEIKKLRTKVAEVTARAADQHADNQHRLDEATKRFEDEVSRLTKDNELLRGQLAQMSASIQGIMETRAARSAADSKTRDAIAAEAERVMKQQVAAVVAEKEKQVGNLKAQSQHFLRAKAEAASKAEEQLLALRSRSEAEISALQAEIEHLAVYAERVTEVLRRMEAGVYPIVDKAGVRAFRLPARDRPAALDGTRLNYLMRKGESAQRLLEATQAAAAGPPPSLLLGTGSRVQGGAVSGGSVAGGESMRRGSGEGSRQQQQGSSSSGQGEGAEGDVSSSGAAAGGPAVASPSGQLLAAAVPPGSLGPDLEELRSQWERDMRGLITSQVVSELSSDRTVEYIRSLEVAVARYRTELQQERRRQSEMTVALRSAQRVVSRPGSAIQQVMSGKVITLPPSWGYGHSSGFSPMATRPATAGARLNSSSMYQAAGAFTKRPPTATAMQMLTSAFTDNGVGYFAKGLQ